MTELMEIMFNEGFTEGLKHSDPAKYKRLLAAVAKRFAADELEALAARLTTVRDSAPNDAPEHILWTGGGIFNRLNLPPSSGSFLSCASSSRLRADRRLQNVSKNSDETR